jgi:hypothetical protein
MVLVGWVFVGWLLDGAAAIANRSVQECSRKRKKGKKQRFAKK